jgi:hypothetical protein
MAHPVGWLIGTYLSFLQRRPANLTEANAPAPATQPPSSVSSAFPNTGFKTAPKSLRSQRGLRGVFAVGVE